MKVRQSIAAEKNEKEARYKGQVQDTIRDGHGVYNFAWGGNDLFSYDGPWVKGQREGSQGKFSINGISEYTGQFLRGEITGVGKRIWASGNIYEGEFLDGECHGKNGKWQNRDGSETYEGEFCYNKREGKGTLRKGAYVYRGQFKSHKMHGIGIFLRENLFFAESTFQSNIIQGKAKIKWHKLCDLECNMLDGYPDGTQGIFTTIDGSFDFEGSWSKGFPSFNQTAKYIWSDLDRSMVKDPEPEGDGGKKKAAAPQKKKGVVDENEPSIVAFPGVQLGKVSVRTGLTPENEFPVPPPNPKAAKGEPPPKPVMPTPEPFSIPRERRRLVILRLRPEKYSVEGAIELGDPMNLWLRKRSLDEFGGSRLRFPPASTVFIDGVCAGSPRSPAPILSLESRLDANIENNIIDETLTLTPAAEKSEVDAADGVRSLKLCNGETLSFQIETRALPQAHEAMTFSMDFKFDVTKIDATFGTKYDVPAMLAVTAAAAAAATTPGASRAERRTAKAALSAAATLQRQLQAAFTEFSVLSLSRVFEGIEVKTSRLQLVLLVPDSNILDLCRIIRETSANSTQQQQTATPSATEASGMVDKLVDLGWLDCFWELRLLTTVMEPIPNDPTVPTPNGDSEADGKAAVIFDMPEPPAAEQDPSSIPLDVEESPEPEQQFRPVTQTIVCGRWHAAALNPAAWHSLALSLRAPGEQSGEGPVASSSPVRSSVESVDQNAGTSMGVSPYRAVLSATMIAGAGKSTAVVDLVVDGCGKMRAGISPAASLTTTSVVEDGGPSFQSEGQIDISDEITEGVVLGWIPEPPLPPQPQSVLPADGALGDDTDEKTSDASNPPAVTAPPDPEDFWLLMRAGGPGFEGSVKALSACSKGDRCDVIALTGCYEAHRQQEREWVYLKQQADHQQDGDEPKDPVPWDCSNVAEVPFVLFCGSGEIDRIVLPTQTPEGVYVLEVVDGVNETCRRPLGEGLLSESEQQDVSETEEGHPREKEPLPASDKLQRMPEDIKDMCRVITSLPASRIIRMKVNAAGV